MKFFIYLYILLLINNNFSKEIYDSELEKEDSQNFEFKQKDNNNKLPDIDESICNNNEFLNLKTENCECLEGFQGSDCSDCLNNLDDGDVYICCNLASSLEQPKNFQLIKIPKEEERNFLTGVYTIESCLKQNSTIFIDENEVNLDCNCRLIGSDNLQILFYDNSISSLISNSLLNQNNLFIKRFDNRLINLQDELIIANAILPCDTFDGTPVFNTGLIVFIIVAALAIIIVIIAGIFMCNLLYTFTTSRSKNIGAKMRIEKYQLSEKKKLLRKNNKN